MMRTDVPFKWESNVSSRNTCALTRDGALDLQRAAGAGSVRHGFPVGRGNYDQAGA